jgi:hypothetical protein
MFWSGGEGGREGDKREVIFVFWKMLFRCLNERKIDLCQENGIFFYFS